MSNLGNKEIMAKNIRYYMDKYDKTRQEMCDALGVKYTTFTDWVKGNSYPRIDKIEMMANYFGISKADLVEDHNDMQQSEMPYYLNDETRQIAQEAFENPELPRGQRHSTRTPEGTHRIYEKPESSGKR